MRLNERVLKVLPLLTTPNEANRGHSEATLAGPFSPWEKVRMRVRVHPYRPRRRYECNQMEPNATELKVSPLLTTPNRAKQGQMGPRFRPPARERINLLIPQRASVLC